MIFRSRIVVESDTSIQLVKPWTVSGRLKKHRLPGYFIGVGTPKELHSTQRARNLSQVGDQNIREGCDWDRVLVDKSASAGRPRGTCRLMVIPEDAGDKKPSVQGPLNYSAKRSSSSECASRIGRLSLMV
jgi:hypothetical protein